MNNFELYSQYYDLLYQDKNYEAEAKYIDQLIKNHLLHAQSVLELGSGTGKHAFLLADLGYQIFGLEKSEAMVNLANKRAHENVKFKVADITDFKLDQRFDVTISLFHVISYLTDTKRLIQAFSNVNQHLNADGLFIFDVWHSPAVYEQIPEKRTKKLESETLAIVREADPIILSEKNVVEVNYTINITQLKDNSKTQFSEKHPMRHFSKPELEILASSTGFEILYSEEFATKNKPSSATWGVCYVLRKIKE